MNYKEFKKSLKFRKYKDWKIIIRFLEYKFKNLFIKILVNLNKYKYNSKKIIDLGSFKDNSYINFFLYSLKDEFIFTYQNDENVTKLFRRIGFFNFFKYTLPQSNSKNESTIKINMSSSELNENEGELSIDTNYYQYLYNKENVSNTKNLVMPYFMYPRIYKSFYKKINIVNKPNFNLRIFFSGSVVEDGYSNFYWKKDPEKFPNRVKTIKSILKEFKSEIFLINSRSDLKTAQFNKKKIIFCLHNKVIKKTSYKLNFKDNFNLLSQSCFNLSCPGVVMPLCHHLIEGIKVGSIPITNCEKLLIPNLNNDISLIYSNLDELIEKFYEALKMEDDRVVYMRSKVQEYYKTNLSPEVFRKNFKKTILDKKNKIICCDDHRSVEGML